MKSLFTKPAACLNHFFSLFFPPVCNACRGLLGETEELVCAACLAKLPRTTFHLHPENQLTRVFWGRVTLQTGTSLFYYTKGGRVQRLIHEFKYRGNLSLGLYLGRMLGTAIGGSPLYSDLDLILPVPLHPVREKERGFNQSEVFSRGISSVLGIPCQPGLLLRTLDTGSQTKRSRFGRWENVAFGFAVNDQEWLSGKRILLTDDVLTTGATLEACANSLLNVEGVKLWVATLAFTP